MPDGASISGANRRSQGIRGARMKAQEKKPEERRAELLIEIGCEEIPAGMLPRAEEDLRTGIEKSLTAENLADGVTVESFAGPRRLAAWVRGVRTKQADVVSEVSGPPKSVAYDAVGAPTRAAVSFAEKQGIGLHDVYYVQTPKGEYLDANQVRSGRTAEQILCEILPRVIRDLYWPKTMTWTGLSGARFFFFQAEDGIRDYKVTGVQTCALPI